MCHNLTIQNFVALMFLTSIARETITKEKQKKNSKTKKQNITETQKARECAGRPAGEEQRETRSCEWTTKDLSQVLRFRLSLNLLNKRST